MFLFHLCRILIVLHFLQGQEQMVHGTAQHGRVAPARRQRHHYLNHKGGAEVRWASAHEPKIRRNNPPFLRRGFQMVVAPLQ